MSETDVLPDLVSYNAYYLMFMKFRTVPAMLRGGTYQNERDAALQRSTFNALSEGTARVAVSLALRCSGHKAGAGQELTCLIVGYGKSGDTVREPGELGSLARQSRTSSGVAQEPLGEADLPALRRARASFYMFSCSTGMCSITRSTGIRSSPPTLTDFKSRVKS